MRNIQVVQRKPLILYLSFAIGVIILFLRILTLPRSPFAVLLWEVLFSLSASIQFLLNFSKPNITQPYFQHFLIAGITILFVIILSWSLIYGLRTVRRNKIKAFLPLGINLLNVLLFIGLHQLVVQPDFYLHQAERQAATALVAAKSNTLTVSNSRTVNAFDSAKEPEYRLYTVTLPPEYRRLSTGFSQGGGTRLKVAPGDVEVVRRADGNIQAVVFFRSSGSAAIGPVYTAFVYKPDDTPVTVRDIWGVAGLSFYLGVDDTTKLQSRWYWVDVSED